MLFFLDKNGRTALHEAGRKGFIDCVRFFVADGGVVVNIQDSVRGK
jgi:ankyrin repeat protein